MRRSVAVLGGFVLCLVLFGGMVDRYFNMKASQDSTAVIQSLRDTCALAHLRSEETPEANSLLQICRSQVIQVEGFQVTGVEIFLKNGRRADAAGMPLRMMNLLTDKCEPIINTDRFYSRYEVFWSPINLTTDYGVAIGIDAKGYRNKLIWQIAIVSLVFLFVLGGLWFYGSRQKFGRLV